MIEVAEIKRLFNRRLTQASATSFMAIVKEVNAANRTCVVAADGVSYDDVLLYSVVDGLKKGIVIIPSIQSVVIVSRIGGSNELYISMFSEIDKTLLAIEDVDCCVSKNGYKFNVGSSGIKKTLTDLVDAISKLTVTTAVGPSGTPINVADFQKIKRELDKYLE
ncbi:MAG: hypothetical protein RRZ64_08535 [Rikenellaceae bacterium]